MMKGMKTGRMWIEAGQVCYVGSDDDQWRVPVESVAVIAEYVNGLGPFVDDYYLVFVLATGDRWESAELSTEGIDDVLARLCGQEIAARALLGRTDQCSHVLWPPALAGRPLLDVESPEVHGKWKKLLHWCGWHREVMSLSTGIETYLAERRKLGKPGQTRGE